MQKRHLDRFIAGINTLRLAASAGLTAVTCHYLQLNRTQGLNVCVRMSFHRLPELLQSLVFYDSFRITTTVLLQLDRFGGVYSLFHHYLFPRYTRPDLFARNTKEYIY